jgi:prepilin-type N-terminal cleavage/methylation domain-containing protein
MMLKILRSIRHEQDGFSLVEMLAALIITALIGFGAAAATNQIITQAPENADYSAASNQVANAIHWISRDAQMSQDVTTEGAAGFPLTLTWIEWDNSEHQIIYTLDDSTIKRSYSIDGAEPSGTVVAQYINENTGLTRCDYDDGILTIKVTATIGVGEHAVEVTRLRDVTPRPNL